MKLETVFFIDIESCLIETRSGHKFPVHSKDWKFNDFVLEYIINNDFDRVCLIADRPTNFILRPKGYERLLATIQEAASKILKKTPVHVSYFPTAESYFKYPYPGAILNFAIEHDVNLAMSVYITDNEKASRLATVGIIHTYSNFLLNG